MEWIQGAGHIQLVSELSLDAIPRGSSQRLLIELTRDALAHPICVPVMVIKGAKPGPVFGITAALHGNELNGIPVIQRLFQKIDRQTLRGTLVAIVVANPPAYLRHQREFTEGTDLNHLMPGVEHGNEAQLYAYRLFDRIARHFDYMIDLHTASFGRINSLYIRADMKHPVASQMAYLQRPQIIVHNPASDHTLRGAAMALDIPSITLEIGNPHRFQPDFIKRSLVGIRAVLAEVGMIAKRPMAMGPQPVLCEGSFWLYTDSGGLLEVHPNVTDLVEEGECIATQSNIFGDVIRSYHSPQKGVVIGKSVNPVAQSGARILHLGSIADEPEQFQPRKPWKTRNLSQQKEQ
jgi:predicted deacylase